MKRLLVVVAAVMILGGVVWLKCDRIGSGTRKPPSAEVLAAKKALASPDAKKLIAADNDFALQLLAATVGKHKSENVCLCAAGLSQALRLTQLGAGGTTAAEFKKAMGPLPGGAITAAETIRNLRVAGSDPDPYVHASIADCLWIDNRVSLSPVFTDLIAHKAGVEMRRVELGSEPVQAEIAKWFGDHTEGKIADVPAPSDSETAIVFTNAVYFKGEWRSKFDKSQTRPDEFECFDGKKRQVQTMHMASQLSSYWNGDLWAAAVKLPYGNGGAAFYAVLPADDLVGLIADLRKQGWSAFRSGFGRSEPQRLSLPRFKTEWSGDLVAGLKALGLKSAFGRDSADFSNAAADDAAWIQSIRQAVAVVVDEEGTEAAAALKQSMGCAKSEGLNFDRPFFWAIVDEQTGAILFLGVFGKP